MPDTNTRFILPKQAVRGQVVQLENSHQTILSLSNYPAPIVEILGQALAAVAALGSIIKMQGSMILQIQGEGQIHTLVTQANSKGEIRGLANHSGIIAADDSYLHLLGKGRLVLTVDATGSQRYQGIVEIQGGTLSANLEAYFAQSEQLSTHIHLAANQEKAACFLLQQLPDEPNIIKGTSHNNFNAWQHIQTLGRTLSDQELLGLEPTELLHRLFHQETVQLFEPTPLRFHCQCSRAKISPIILQMGLKEALILAHETGEIRADCEFCNQNYRFKLNDIKQLFKHETDASATRH